MKRVLGYMLPLLLVAACTEEADTITLPPSFTSGYDLGTQVVLEGQQTSTTKRFVELNGVVAQVDDIDANTVVPNTNAACQVRTDKQSTVIGESVSTVTKTRIAGHQVAWILPGSYGNPAGEGGANVWGDPSWGWIFVTEPSIDILLSVQSAGAGDTRHLTQYLRTTPVNLFVFESDSDRDMQTDTTVSTLTTSLKTVVIDETTAAGQDRALSTFGRYDLQNYVWQTTNLNGLYQGAPVNFGSTLVVPSTVEIGDTWINNAGNLMSAVGTDVIEVGDTAVRALHVVERGATDNVLQADKGVSSWCINFYSDRKDNTTERKATEITDLCNGIGAFAGRGVEGVGTGWINLRHAWYYKGLVVKEEMESADIDVIEYGYAVPNTNGTIPAGADRNNAAGQCSLYYDTTPIVTNAAISAYKPYAVYTVRTTKYVAVAKEIKHNYTIAQEYKESQVAQ